MDEKLNIINLYSQKYVLLILLIYINQKIFFSFILFKLIFEFKI